MEIKQGQQETCGTENHHETLYGMLINIHISVLRKSYNILGVWIQMFF